MSPTDLYSIEAAYTKLGIKRTLFYKLINTGQIRTIKIGYRRLVTQAAIDDFVGTLDAQGAQ